MLVFRYKSSGGKDLIIDFIESLSMIEKAEGYYLLEHLESIDNIEECIFETRKIQNKIWEIKFKNHNRIFYILNQNNNIYLLHACKKQKNKTEQHDKSLAIKRSKEIE